MLLYLIVFFNIYQTIICLHIQNNLILGNNITFLFNVTGNCNFTNCFAPYGFCKNDKLCQCNIGYSELVNIKNQSTKYCQYFQKLQSTAFGLELFLSSGIGHLYCGRIAIGALKFAFVLIFCVYYGVLKKKFYELENQSLIIPENERNKVIEFTIVMSFCLSIIVLILWQVIDLYNFGTNKYKDGNKVPLLAW